MLLTKASEYALLSLIIISQKNTPQDVDTLSNQLGISKSFLAKILQALAKENILSSFKGAHGGFMLAKKPEELTLKMIVECAEKNKLWFLNAPLQHKNAQEAKARIVVFGLF